MIFAFKILESSLTKNKNLAHIICPLRVEKEYFWKLADVLKNESKVIKYLKLKKRQASLEDQLNMRNSNVLCCGGLWEEVANQYYSMGLYEKAEPIYRMMLIRSCDFAGTSKSIISKVLPPPRLKKF